MVSDAPFANRQLHFVGIGGCGMSGLALVARSLGARVSGSDQKESIYTGSLRRHGITDIALGHRREQVPPAPAEVVYTGATAATVEVEAAHERGQAAMHRSELLAELTAAHRRMPSAAPTAKARPRPCSRTRSPPAARTQATSWARCCARPVSTPQPEPAAAW